MKVIRVIEGSQIEMEVIRDKRREPNRNRGNKGFYSEPDIYVGNKGLFIEVSQTEMEIEVIRDQRGKPDINGGNKG